MQQPTCTNIRIRSTQDAHRIFYAVQKGVLRMVTRRLDAEERLALTTGCIYVWEERGPHSEITGLGIERFTEGRRWTPSRVRDEFLFYYERYTRCSSSHPGEPIPRPHDWDQLVKQTYSVWVDTEKGRRKWHLTAYFTDKTVNDLSTIEDIPRARDLIVPPGLYQSTRVAKNRNRSEEQPNSSNKMSSKHPPSTISRTYAPFSHYDHYPSQSASPPASESVTMYDPYKSCAASRHSPRSSTNYSATSHHQQVALQPQGPSQRLPSPPQYLPPPLPYVGVDNPRASSSSTMPPNQLPTSPTWSRVPSIGPYPSQAIPRGISSPYGYSEPYSLPPVSTVYDEHQFPSLRSTPEPSSRALYDNPYAHAALPREASYELASRDGNDLDRRRGSLASERELALAPIHALERRHPYRRDPVDDEALRLLPR
ncbi:hypothetical protein FPV67DRAFT_1043351 [Lyophyllum atratum]|nr:hypothetical protein FPV67DRAFT_1043351 [Lyophyllum atratum]